MATFWERAVHSVDHVFSLCNLLVILVSFCFGFEGGIWALIAPVLGHCLLFTYIVNQKQNKKVIDTLRHSIETVYICIEK